jgi:hypothetical protein
MNRVLSVLCLLCCLPATTALADPQTYCLSPNIRPSQGWITRTLCQHARHSATLRRLLTAVGAAPLVVYVEEAGGTPGAWDGRIRFVGRAASWRYVVIDVRSGAPGPVVAALLAHELQHALEVDGGPVENFAEFRSLFARIGFASGVTGVDTFDTAAAIDAGVDTLRELTGREPILTARPYRSQSRQRH